MAGLQAACLLVFALCLQVIDIGSPSPRTSIEAIPRQFERPDVPYTLQSSFADQIELIGYDLPSAPYQPGAFLNATLYWRSLTEPKQSYKVFVHLLDDSGQLLSQVDGVPVDWKLPTTCWVRGEYIVDPFSLHVPSATAPGTYKLAVGLYLESTGERLPITSDAGSKHNSVSLGPIRVN
jgi:hypothetical protein